MSKKFFDIIPPKIPSSSFSFERKDEEKPQLSVEGEVLKKSFERKKSGKFKKIIGSFSLFLLFIFLLLHFVFSKVEIEIWPQTETLNFEEKVVVDTKTNQLDLNNKIIPGKIFEDSKTISQQFSSTGKTTKELSSQGIIRVYNNYHLSQTLIKNTRFQPPLEKVVYFCSKKTVVIPPKSELDVEVIACLPGGKPAVGEEYNIGPSTFSIPGLAGLPQYYSIYGKSFSPMSGGFKGEVLTVSEEDLEKAKKILLEKLEKETKELLKSRFSEEFILLEEGLLKEVIDATSSLPAGAEAEFFNFSLKIGIKIIIFEKAHLNNFVTEFIKLNIQENDKKIQPESLKTDYFFETVDMDSGKMFLNLKISARIYPDIDKNSFKKGISNKSLDEVRLLLKNQPQINRSQVKVFPFWLKKIPDKLEKIKVNLNL